MSWSGAAYDEVADPQLRWGSDVLDRVGPELARRPAARVLDAGCGSGRVTEALLERAPSATVVAGDVSPSMLDAARERLARFGDRVRVVALNLEADPLVADDPFDLVLSTGTLHWVREHGAMYRRLAGALCPGGALVAQCGGEGSIAEVRAALDELGVDWRQLNHYAGVTETTEWLRAADFVDAWVWLTEQPVTFGPGSDLIGYLLDGVLAPYLEPYSPDERSELARAVVDRLDDPTVLRFVRLNVLARVPPVGDGPRLGIDRGRFEVPADFDAPLPDGIFER